MKRASMWRRLKVLGTLFVIAALMVAIDGPLMELMRGIDGDAKAVIDWFALSGDSKYSLAPLALAVAACLAMYLIEASTVRARLYAWLAGAFGFVFVSIAFSGIVVNIVKILVGRARPQVAEVLNSPIFQPFASSGDFHSFPSGHANTVFAIAIAVGLFFPKIRMHLLAAAAALAFCRVLQFKHFISDSVGGALFAYMTTYWLRSVFARRNIVFCRGRDGCIRVTSPGRFLLSRRFLRKIGFSKSGARADRGPLGRVVTGKGAAG